MNQATYPSLLSRDESKGIKGLLILLIVLGHNALIMKPTGLFPYLYAFHVYCFYILPFIYGSSEDPQPTSSFQAMVRHTWHNVCSLYPLYLIWCIIGIPCACIWRHSGVSLWPTLYAIVSGHQTLLAQYCGFSFLWFLPTIVAVMFWRNLYFLLPGIGKILLFSSSIFLWGLAVMGIANSYSLGLYFPFALAQGLYFSAAGIMARWILVRSRVSTKTRIAALPLFLLIPLFIWYRQFLSEGCHYLSWLFPPVIAFYCIYQYKDFLSKNRWIMILGDFSLQIYLLHTIFYNILLRLSPWKNIFAGIVIYLLTIVACFLCAFSIKKTFLRFLLFR